MVCAGQIFCFVLDNPLSIRVERLRKITDRDNFCQSRLLVGLSVQTRRMGRPSGEGWGVRIQGVAVCKNSRKPDVALLGTAVA
jgi:hypothetical protein